MFSSFFVESKGWQGHLKNKLQYCNLIFNTLGKNAHNNVLKNLIFDIL
jgi:hypothetical protein